MKQAKDLKKAFDDVRYAYGDLQDNLSILGGDDLNSVNGALIDLESAMATLDSAITDSVKESVEYEDYHETMELAFWITRSNVEKLVGVKAAALTEAQLELDV